MNFAARMLLASALLLPFLPSSLAQAELVEEVKRLAGEIADLRDANSTQTRRMTQMQKEIDSLREALRDSHDRSISKMGDFATREDLKKIVENIREVDQKREADRKLILEEFEKLGRTLAQPAERTERPSSRRTTTATTATKEKEREKEIVPIEGTFLPYDIKPGQILSDIVTEYNDALKQEGRPSVTIEQVKRANPKMNPNRILAGQKILLPVPDKKKP